MKHRTHAPSRPRISGCSGMDVPPDRISGSIGMDAHFPGTSGCSGWTAPGCEKNVHQRGKRILHILACILLLLPVPAAAHVAAAQTQSASMALLESAAATVPEGSSVSIITTSRAIVRGTALHATALGMLVWISDMPVDREQLAARTTFVRADDILAIEYEAVSSAWRGAAIGAAIGAAGLALPILVAGAVSDGPSGGIQLGDVTLAAAAGAVAGGVVGGLLAGGTYRMVTLSIGGSSERYASALGAIHDLCMYGVTAPPDIVRLLPVR